MAQEGSTRGCLYTVKETCNNLQGGLDHRHRFTMRMIMEVFLLISESIYV
jgi:hypothetical protein